jgi:VWFA-related protein
MKARIAFLLTLASAFLLATMPTVAHATSAGLIAATASEAGAAADAGPTVTLDVFVSDKSGNPVRGLQAQDFKVLDNKQPRNIQVFRAFQAPTAGAAPAAAEPPVEAILVIDMINARSEVMADERRNLIEYLKQSGGRLAVPTSFVFLSDSDVKIQGQPTRDANVLLAALDANQPVRRELSFQGGDNAAIQMRESSLQALGGLALKLSEKPGRKLVIWISPGWLSFTNVSTRKSAQEQRQLYDYIANLTTVLRMAEITLYSVDPEGAASSENNEGDRIFGEYAKGVANPGQADNGNLVLQAIAAQTGGKVLFGNNNSAGMVQQCLGDARDYYEVTFDAPHAEHPNEFHGIQIEVDKPKVKTRTRVGYYAQP